MYWTYWYSISNWTECGLLSVPSDIPPKKTKKRTWTHAFCCLQKKSTSKCPSQADILNLHRNGLGVKDVTFGYDDTAEDVLNTLLM